MARTRVTVIKLPKFYEIVMPEVKKRCEKDGLPISPQLAEGPNGFYYRITTTLRNETVKLQPGIPEEELAAVALELLWSMPESEILFKDRIYESISHQAPTLLQPGQKLNSIDLSTTDRGILLKLMEILTTSLGLMIETLGLVSDDEPVYNIGAMTTDQLSHIVTWIATRYDF